MSTNAREGTKGNRIEVARSGRSYEGIMRRGESLFALVPSPHPAVVASLLATGDCLSVRLFLAELAFSFFCVWLFLCALVRVATQVHGEHLRALPILVLHNAQQHICHVVKLFLQRNHDELARLAVFAKVSRKFLYIAGV